MGASYYDAWLGHPGLKVVNLFSRSTQLNMKFILLINVKMPAIAGILTFISRINTTTQVFVRKIFILQDFSFYELLKFHTGCLWEVFDRQTESKVITVFITCCCIWE